jgi:hypothetical protein
VKDSEAVKKQSKKRTENEQVVKTAKQKQESKTAKEQCSKRA